MTFDETQAVPRPTPPTTGATTRARVPVDRAPRQSEPLVAYFADIAHIPTLSREEQILLAKEVEAGTREFREALYAIPWTAQELVRIWRHTQQAGRTTSKLSESFGNQSPEVGRQLDDCLTKVERLVRRREKALAAPRNERDEAAMDRLDQRAVRLLIDADVSLQLLRRIRTRLLARRAKLRRRKVSPEAELGLAAGPLSQRMDAMEKAHERMSEAKNRFVWHNLKLVVSVAKDFRNLGIAFPDLIQEGNTGLIRAVEKFDWRRGFTFSTYAVWWIRQALIRAIQNHSRTIRIPSHQYDALRRYEQARAELGRVLERAPTPAEIGEAMGVPEERAEELAGLVAEPLSLDGEVGGQDSTKPRRLEDLVEDPDVAHPSEGMDHLRLERVARDAVERLPERERQILRWRFGLDGEGEHTLQEIGQRLGLSRERARQLEAGALRKLRESADGPSLAAFAEEVA